MFLDRVSPRVQITMVVSVGLHLLLVRFFGTHQFSEAPRKIKLTEVEFQQEVEKPSEMEKLMTKLAPPKPEPGLEQQKIAAIEELEKTSFSKVVGLKQAPKLEPVSELDLTNLAALPKLGDLAKQPPPPVLSGQGAKRIALAPSRSSELRALESKVVPLEGLPPADFGPGISKRNFQQPELIINKVKAERRQTQAAPKAEKLSLRRESFITGEVKNRGILHQEYPEIPRWLEEKGIEAEVVIRFVVNPDGEVGDKIFVEKTSGYAELDRLAITALKKFLFAPLPLNVRQVEQSGSIVIHFGFRQ